MNVTNYGAIGDLLTLQPVSTVSNSSSIACPGAHFVDGDRRKLIEVFGGGEWCGVSNQTLIAYIAKVLSPTTVIVNRRAGVTASGLSGCYGTDDALGFRKAIAHTSRMATIIIPAGNYLLAPREAVFGYPPDVSHVASVYVTRGGLTFEGQGNVTLTQSGWVRNGHAIGSDSSGERGAMFCIQAPMEDNYPLIFTNLTFFGGEKEGWIHNESFPSSDQTGLGWDMSHHALSFEHGDGGNFVDTVGVENCVFHGWRGEVLITTYVSANTFMTASNCVFTDNNATALNVDFAHLWIDDLFSNMDQTEEFYRDFATMPSVMADCVIVNCGPIALNGGYYFEPPYTICSNVISGVGWTVFACPASEFNFIYNKVTNPHGVAIGSAGYQDPTYNSSNSNLLIAWNSFNGCDYPFQVFGSGSDLAQDVTFTSNLVQNAWGIGGGYGYSTNVFVSNNSCTNVGWFDEWEMGGQWFLDVSNNYGANGQGTSVAQTNLFSYDDGARGIIEPCNPGSVFALDDTHPGKVPAGAIMVISNASTITLPLYPTASLAGKSLALAAGMNLTFQWNGKNWVIRQ